MSQNTLWNKVILYPKKYNQQQPSNVLLRASILREPARKKKIWSKWYFINPPSCDDCIPREIEWSWSVSFVAATANIGPGQVSERPIRWQCQVVNGQGAMANTCSWHDQMLHSSFDTYHHLLDSSAYSWKYAVWSSDICTVIAEMYSCRCHWSISIVEFFFNTLTICRTLQVNVTTSI